LFAYEACLTRANVKRNRRRVSETQIAPDRITGAVALGFDPEGKRQYGFHHDDRDPRQRALCTRGSFRSEERPRRRRTTRLVDRKEGAGPRYLLSLSADIALKIAPPERGESEGCVHNEFLGGSASYRLHGSKVGADMGCGSGTDALKPGHAAGYSLCIETRMSGVGWPPQPIDATQALNFSAGVSNPSVLRGRSFS